MRSSPDQGRSADTGKSALRRRLLDARAARSTEERAAATEALATHVISLAWAPADPIACYLPMGSEPGAAGSGPAALPDLLLAAGWSVVVPVVPAAAGPLDWAAYTGPDDLVPGPFGVREPAGARLGTGAVTGLALVLVPALAVDRRGGRLGRGGGFYDRTLPLVPSGTPTVVPLYDDELLGTVPTEEHDVRVSAVVLPGAGVVHVSP